jgi:hypothetical protein
VFGGGGGSGNGRTSDAGASLVTTYPTVAVDRAEIVEAIKKLGAGLHELNPKLAVSVNDSKLVAAVRAKLVNGWDATVLADRALEESLPKEVVRPSGLFAKRINDLPDVPDESAVAATAERLATESQWCGLLASWAQIAASKPCPAINTPTLRLVSTILVDRLSAPGRLRINGNTRVDAKLDEMQGDIDHLSSWTIDAMDERVHWPNPTDGQRIADRVSIQTVSEIIASITTQTRTLDSLVAEYIDEPDSAH